MAGCMQKYVSEFEGPLILETLALNGTDASERLQRLLDYINQGASSIGFTVRKGPLVDSRMTTI